MGEKENRKRLYALAQNDMIYMMWKQSYEDFTDSFYDYVKEQNETVQNVLCGYADAGRLMMQRMVNIACKEMEFSKELLEMDE